MRTRKFSRGGVALAIVAAAGMTSACATVSPDEYDAGIEALRAELTQAIEEGDAANAQRINALEDRVDQVESRLQQFASDLQSMEEEYGAQVERLQTQLRFNVPVYFNFDQAEITPRAEEILGRFQEVADEYYPSALITVEGHTDPSGSEAYNLDLGMRRAEAVRTWLLGQGMVDTRVRAVSHGEAGNRIVAEGQQGPGTEGWENRRVVMVIDHDGEPPAQVTMQETVGLASTALAPVAGR